MMRCMSIKWKLSVAWLLIGASQHSSPMALRKLIFSPLIKLIIREEMIHNVMDYHIHNPLKDSQFGNQDKRLEGTNCFFNGLPLI